MAKPAPETAAVRSLGRLHVLPGRRRRSRPEGAASRRDRRLTRSWGWGDNIVGIGVGLKRTRGANGGGEPCITLFVRHKLPKRRLNQQEIVPERLDLDTARASVLTDIVVLGSRPVAHAVRVRPLRPGAEVGHVRGGRGTLGLLVRRVGTTEPLALSCSHVIARSGRLPDGLGRIEQPVTDGSDGPEDLVGDLLDGFSRLHSGTSASNRDDVALARLAVPASPALLATDRIPLTASSFEAHQFPQGMRTVLNGLTTSDAHGHVLAHEAMFTIGEMPFVNGEVPFTGLVAYHTRCGRGDSGAAVMEEGASQVLGIHTAGIADQSFGLFQPIGPILARLGLELVKS